MQDGYVCGCRIQSRANGMAEAKRSVLDNLPLVSPPGFHFQNGRLLVMLQRVGSEQFGLDFPPSVSARVSSAVYVRGSNHSQVDERSASAKGILQQEEEEGCVPSSHSQSLGQDPWVRTFTSPPKGKQR